MWSWPFLCPSCAIWRPLLAELRLHGSGTCESPHLTDRKTSAKTKRRQIYSQLVFFLRSLLRWQVVSCVDRTWTPVGPQESSTASYFATDGTPWPRSPDLWSVAAPQFHRDVRGLEKVSQSHGQFILARWVHTRPGPVLFLLQWEKCAWIVIRVGLSGARVWIKRQNDCWCTLQINYSQLNNFTLKRCEG